MTMALIPSSFFETSVNSMRTCLFLRIETKISLHLTDWGLRQDTSIKGSFSTFPQPSRVSAPLEGLPTALSRNILTSGPIKSDFFEIWRSSVLWFLLSVSGSDTIRLVGWGPWISPSVLLGNNFLNRWCPIPSNETRRILVWLPVPWGAITSFSPYSLPSESLTFSGGIL